MQALLGQLGQASTSWYDVVLLYAQSLFFALVGFQLLWTSITFALGRREGGEFISTLFIMVIDVGFFYSLMLHPNWVLDILESFRVIGQDASKLDKLTPDAIIDTGLHLASSIITSISTTGLVNFAVSVLVAVFIAIAILASFAFIAARMVLVLAEIFFAINVSPLLLAFSGLSATRYIATQYIGYVISSGIQLFVMYLLIGAGLDIAKTWSDIIAQHGSDDVNAFMLVGLASALYGVLVWNLPKLIGGLASGAPQMSSGGIVAAAAGMAAGFGAARAPVRGLVNSGQWTANTARAAVANYGARRDGSGGSNVAALSRTAATTLGAGLASGVNTVLGRHGHRGTPERIWTSTAKTNAAKASSEADDRLPQNANSDA